MTIEQFLELLTDRVDKAARKSAMTDPKILELRIDAGVASDLAPQIKALLELERVVIEFERRDLVGDYSKAAVDHLRKARERALRDG